MAAVCTVAYTEALLQDPVEVPVLRGFTGTGCGPPPVSPRPVAAAGLYFNRADHRPYRWSAWWAFACPGHAHELIAARPLFDRDRAEIARRRDVCEQWTPGRYVEALAVGRPAAELVDRARRWAAAHPEQS